MVLQWSPASCDAAVVGREGKRERERKKERKRERERERNRGEREPFPADNWRRGNSTFRSRRVNASLSLSLSLFHLHSLSLSFSFPYSFLLFPTLSLLCASFSDTVGRLKRVFTGFFFLPSFFFVLSSLEGPLEIVVAVVDMFRLDLTLSYSFFYFVHPSPTRSVETGLYRVFLPSFFCPLVPRRSTRSCCCCWCVSTWWSTLVMIFFWKRTRLASSGCRRKWRKRTKKKKKTWKIEKKKEKARRFRSVAKNRSCRWGLGWLSLIIGTSWLRSFLDCPAFV